MKLQIPKDKAIEILKARLSELNSYTFNPKAWKDRTILDLKEIFPHQHYEPWLQVSGITFDTYVTSEKQIVLQRGKETAKKLLNSYIEFINEYSKIQEEREVIEEDNYKTQYRNLLEKWNDLVPDHNDLVEQYSSLREEVTAKDEEILNLQKEIVRIKENTIPLENVRFRDFWKAIISLPLRSTIALIAILFGVIGGCFWLGSYYQVSFSNNQQYDLRVENGTLKAQNEDFLRGIDSLNQVNETLRERLDSTSNSKQ